MSVERELELAESRLKVQEKAVHDSEKALEVAKANAMTQTIKTVEFRLKRQREQLEETRLVIAECQKAIMKKPGK